MNSSSEKRHIMCSRRLELMRMRRVPYRADPNTQVWAGVTAFGGTFQISVGVFGSANISTPLSFACDSGNVTVSALGWSV